MSSAAKVQSKQYRKLMRDREQAILVGLVWASELKFSEKVKVAWGILTGKWRSR